jgi:pyruvate formate-lyase activating enzyme-like uncharacterized protein
MKINDIKQSEVTGIYIRLKTKKDVSGFAYYPIKEIENLIEDIKSVNAKSVPGKGGEPYKKVKRTQ